MKAILTTVSIILLAAGTCLAQGSGTASAPRLRSPAASAQPPQNEGPAANLPVSGGTVAGRLLGRAEGAAGTTDVWPHPPVDCASPQFNGGASIASADNSAALTACIQYSLQHKVPAYIPSGTYRILNPVNWTCTRTQVLNVSGDGKYKTIIAHAFAANNADYPAVDIGGCNAAHVANLQITPLNNNPANSQASFGLLLSNGTSGNEGGGGTLIDSTILNGGSTAGGPGLGVINADLVMIHDSDITRDYGYGGLIIGDDPGYASAAKSAFYGAIPLGTNPTQNYFVHSDASASNEPALELTGGGLRVTSSYVAIVHGGAPEIVDFAPAFRPEHGNYLWCHDLRTENQSTRKGVNVFYWQGGSNTDNTMNCTGSFNTDSSGAVFAGAPHLTLTGIYTQDSGGALRLFNLPDGIIYNSVMNAAYSSGSLGTNVPSLYGVTLNARHILCATLAEIHGSGDIYTGVNGCREFSDETVARDATFANTTGDTYLSFANPRTVRLRETGGGAFALGNSSTNWLTLAPNHFTLYGSANLTAIQGSDTKLLSSGTISGTGAPLCTDARGGATTIGCKGSGDPAVGDSKSNGGDQYLVHLATCIPGNSINSQCTGTITLSPGYSDANYGVWATMNVASRDATSRGATSQGATSQGSQPDLLFSVRQKSGLRFTYLLTCAYNCSYVPQPYVDIHTHHP